MGRIQQYRSDLFRDSVSAINPGATDEEVGTALAEISLLLDNEDLGKSFYERLIETSGRV